MFLLYVDFLKILLYNLNMQSFERWLTTANKGTLTKEKEIIMHRTLIKNLSDFVDSEVKVCGFVEKIRVMKRNQFLVLRDQTGKVQLYIDSYQNSELAAIVEGLTEESTIQAIGTVVKNPSVKLGGIEIAVSDIFVESISKATRPINQDSSIEVRLDWRFLDLRDPKKLLIFKTQTVAEQAMREFWIKNGFLEIHSPKLMGTASESGSELFKVPYFGTTAYLSQSPQFYKQMAMNAGFDRIFEIGPVFRANPSFTSRHATEFVCVDSEISWIDSYEDIMKFEESWIQYVMGQIKEKLGNEIKEMYGIDVVIPTTPFPRIQFAEAKKIVRETGYICNKADDLEPEEERILWEYAQKNFGNDWLFVTEYPASARPFYQMRCHYDNSLTCSYDLLYKGLEVTTGSQREHHYDVLKSQILEKQVTENDSKLLESLKYYLSFFEYGAVPHGGFGFGLSRFIMKLFNLSSIREAMYLFRGPKRLVP